MRLHKYSPLMPQTTQIVVMGRAGWGWTQVKECFGEVGVSTLTGGVVHRSAAVVAEQGSVQVGVRLLQGHTQVEEMVALFAHQHLQKVVHFLSAGRTVLVQFEPVQLTQGAGDDQQFDDSVRIRYGLQQVLVALVEQLFVLWLHCYPLQFRSFPS